MNYCSLENPVCIELNLKYRCTFIDLYVRHLRLYTLVRRKVGCSTDFKVNKFECQRMFEGRILQVTIKSYSQKYNSQKQLFETNKQPT